MARVSRSSALWLLLVPLASADLGDFDLGATIRGLPGMMRSNFRQLKVGTKQMWINSKEAGVVKKRVKAGGPSVSYSEHQLLRKASEDTFKLVQAGIVWLVAPELIPAMLYFYPRSLPSTFESEEGAAKRHATLCRLRASATLQLLVKLDEDAARNGRKARAAGAQRLIVMQMLKARSVGGAAAPIGPFAVAPAVSEKSKKRQGKARANDAIKPLPPPFVKTSCKLIGLSGPTPPLIGASIRRGALAGHLQQLVEEDEVLQSTDLSALSREELLEACLDRALGRPEASDAQLRRELSTWLALVHPKPAAAAPAPDPHRLRLVTMAASATMATRTAPEVALPRLLFSS